MFKGLGLQRLEGDEAVYHKKDEKGELEGMVSTCVDDLDLALKFQWMNMLRVWRKLR